MNDTKVIQPDYKSRMHNYFACKLLTIMKTILVHVKQQTVDPNC